MRHAKPFKDWIYIHDWLRSELFCVPRDNENQLTMTWMLRPHFYSLIDSFSYQLFDSFRVQRISDLHLRYVQNNICSQ